MRLGLRNGRQRLAVAAVVIALGASAVWSATASAAFHLIKVREIHPGSSDDSYVVLQMLQAGENFVGGHRLRVYDAGGATVHTFTFEAAYAAPNGSHGNNTILVGDTGVQAAFGVVPDDHAEAGLEIDRSGGAVCWLSGQPPDCVSWGSFTGNGALPAPGAGTPAAAIPSGQAIRRTIAPNCPTYLEAADDTNDSATDFSHVFPYPRPNSQVPSERRCSPSPPAGGSPGNGPSSPGNGPSNDFSFGKLKKNKRKGTAKLEIEVPGPGDLELAKNKKLKGKQKAAESEGTVKLPIKPKGKAKKKLKRRGKTKVRAKVTYTPDRGEPNTKSKKVGLKKKR